MKKYVIHGSQYKDNFGDTLLLKVLIDALCESGIDSDFIYSSTASYKVSKDLCIKKSSLIEVFLSDYFIYGGGGYFGEPNKNVLKWSLRFIARHVLFGVFRRFFRKKYIFIGTGFGPLSNKMAAYLSSFVIKGADYVLLRDNLSVGFAKKVSNRNDIIETADLVPAYITKKYKKNDSGYIILHLHIPKNDYAKLDVILSNYVLFRDKNYPKCDLYVITDSEQDTEQTWFFSYINEKYPDIIIHQYENYIKTINIISGASFVLTNKLHVSIVAASMKIKVASIYMHHKTPRFFEQINRGHFALPLSKINYQYDLLSFLERVNDEGVDEDAIGELIYNSHKNITGLHYWLQIK